MSDELSPSRWEYRVVPAPSQSALNTLGRDGWDLVAVVADAEGVAAYLKRPLTTFREQVTLDQKERYFRLLGRSAAEIGGAGSAEEELP